MNENLKKLFEEIGNNEALAEKIKHCKTAEEAYAVAVTVVDGYTMEEFKEILMKMGSASKNVNSELSDDDLDQVSGGFDLLTFLQNAAHSSKGALDALKNS